MLEQIVSVAVSDLADFVTCHESFFLQMIGKQQSAGKDQNIRSVKSDIAAEKHRVDEIDRLIAKLYEDNFAGKLSDERYSRMAAKYEKEQAELLQSVSTKEKELAELERESVDIRLLLAGLRGPFFACRDVSGSGAAGRTQGVLRYGNAHAGGSQ